MIKVIEVTNKKQLKQFVRFPTWLYRGSKLYVHPLEIDEFGLFSPKNPSWRDVETKMYLATKDDKIVGRIAVLIHKLYNEKNNAKFARFTRFDVIDDRDVAFALLDTAVEFTRSRGMENIHGPLGFSDIDKEGLLVHGFDRMPTFVNPYNYAYYMKYLEEYGFTKEVDWLEFIIKAPEKMDERVVRIANRMRERLGLTILSNKISVKQIIKKYGKQLFDLINKCYVDLHGVIPITDEVGYSLLKQFKQILRREYVCLIVDSADNLVGFGITAPNISRSLNKAKGRLFNFGFLPINALRIKLESMRPKYIDLCLVAVLPEYQGKGVPAIIINDMFGNLVKKKVQFLESNLQLENNKDVQNLFDGFEKEIVKKRRCYKFTLQK